MISLMVNLLAQVLLRLILSKYGLRKVGLTLWLTLVGFFNLRKTYLLWTNIHQ